MSSSSTPRSSPRRQLLFEERNDESEPIQDNEQIMDINCIKDVSIIHSQLPAESIPKMGLEFETEDEARIFYLAYAKQVGFSVRKDRRYDDKHGQLVDRIFCCHAQGKRRKDKRDPYVKSHRPETRFGCLARMRINKRGTKNFRVIEFEGQHTHYLSSPTKTHMFRAHRNISADQAFEIDMANSVGIAPKAAHEFMARQAGGLDNLGFIQEDYKNYLQSKRKRFVKFGDTGGVLEYLKGKQVADPNFFYAIQLDNHDMVTNIFWCDAKMKSDFSRFGDVICFDTTYRKNNEGRPIALFVGVNHHKLTTIFGAALLYDETAESFEWLFDTFCEAMSGSKPKTILTDQDAAMAKALSTRWPETQHRLCIWHIYQNAMSHLSHVFAKYNSFDDDFSKCIYECEDEEEFLSEWNSMLERYNLEDNDWLMRLFEVRKKWSLAYGRCMFCADMMSTQRSECMNSVLKRYVSYKHKFLEFFNHFERLIKDLRYSELRADFKTSSTLPSLPFNCELLKHASSVYTPEVFTWFWNEWGKSIDSSFVDCGETGNVKKYEVTPHRKKYHY